MNLQQNGRGDGEGLMRDVKVKAGKALEKQPREELGKVGEGEPQVLM